MLSAILVLGLTQPQGRSSPGALKSDLNSRGLTDSDVIAAGTHKILDKIAAQAIHNAAKIP